MASKTITCAWCSKPIDYEGNGEPPDNLICDQCFTDEQAAQERDAQYAEFYCEQQRKRYRNIRIFDNDIDKISVLFRRKVIRFWNYHSPNHDIFNTGREDVMLMAKGFVEGYVDAIEEVARQIGGQRR